MDIHVRVGTTFDPYECIPMCAECDKPEVEVSYKGRTFHKKCIKKCFTRNIADPELLQAFLTIVEES